MSVIKVISEGHMQISINGRWSNNRGITCVFYSSFGIANPVAADFNEVAENYRDAWQSEIMDRLCDNYQILGVNWVQLTALGLVGALEPNAALPQQGANAGGAVPPNVSVLVHKISAARNRQERNGRFYPGPFPEADISEDGVLTGAAQTAWETTLNAFFTAISANLTGGASVTPRNGHWLLEDKPPDPPGGVWQGTSSTVASFDVDPVVATQRRRLRS